MHTLSSVTAQRGAALFTALIFLIIITMLSLTAMRSSMLELRMASNQELRNTAFQRAQAIVDATIGDSANMPSLGAVGATNCMTSDPFVSATDDDGEPICHTSGVKFDMNYLSGYTDLFDSKLENGEVFARVTRLAPLEKPAPRAIGTSASTYSVATYQVDGTYDLSAIGQGRSQIREGVLLLISK